MHLQHLKSQSRQSLDRIHRIHRNEAALIDVLGHGGASFIQCFIGIVAHVEANLGIEIGPTP